MTACSGAGSPVSGALGPKADMDTVEEGILADLRDLDDPLLQYAYLVECGRDLPVLPEGLRTDANLVPECQVRTWLAVQDGPAGRRVQGDSESLAVRGALALVKELCDGRRPEEVAAHTWRLLGDGAFARHYTKTQIEGLKAAIRRVAGPYGGCAMIAGVPEHGEGS